MFGKDRYYIMWNLNIVSMFTNSMMAVFVSPMYSIDPIMNLQSVMYPKYINNNGNNYFQVDNVTNDKKKSSTEIVEQTDLAKSVNLFMSTSVYNCLNEYIHGYIYFMYK